MRQTDNYMFNLLDPSDPLSPTPLNKNFSMLEWYLNSKAVVKSGSYPGSGNAEGWIYLGFRPTAVLMNVRSTGQSDGYGKPISNELSVDGGWVLWAGEETMPAKIYRKQQGTDRYQESDTYLRFTASEDMLSWKLDQTGDIPAAAVNNYPSYVYQWIAIGTET